MKFAMLLPRLLDRPPSLLFISSVTKKGIHHMFADEAHPCTHLLQEATRASSYFLEEEVPKYLGRVMALKKIGLWGGN